jgi:methanogenic corrinoid protein MtbC1
MSVRKTSSRSRRERLSAWLNQNLTSLAASITESHFSAHPELKTRYGVLGYQKCLEDATFHLCFLSEAIASDSPAVFSKYVCWAKIMLASRGINTEDLVENLGRISPVLGQQLRGDQKAIVVNVIAKALAGLGNAPGAVPTFIPPHSPFGQLANAYLNGLLTLNRDAAIQTVMQAVEAGMKMRDLFEYVISPVQKEVGRLWQQNEISVLQEHYCTAATEILLARLRRQFMGGSQRDVCALAICPPGEQHTVGLQMFAELLEADGWRVIYIGANTPTAAVVKFVKVYAVDLVAISMATALNFQNAKGLIAAIKARRRKHGSRIIVGGAAISEDPTLGARLRADAFCATLSEGVDASNRLLKDRAKVVRLS